MPSRNQDGNRGKRGNLLGAISACWNIGHAMPGVKKTDLTIYTANPYNRYDPREVGRNAAIVPVRKLGTLAVCTHPGAPRPERAAGGFKRNISMSSSEGKKFCAVRERVRSPAAPSTLEITYCSSRGISGRATVASQFRPTAA